MDHEKTSAKKSGLRSSIFLFIACVFPCGNKVFFRSQLARILLLTGVTSMSSYWEWKRWKTRRVYHFTTLYGGKHSVDPRGQGRRLAHMDNWVYHLATITNLMDNERKAEGRSPTLRVLDRLPPLKKWSHDLTPNLCPGQLVNPRSGEPENHHLLIYRSRRRSPATTTAVVVYHLGWPPHPFLFSGWKTKSTCKKRASAI